MESRGGVPARVRSRPVGARKMRADEVDIDGTLVGRLVADQFPHWAALRPEPVEPRGTDNALYRLGDELVARLPRTERTAIRVSKEREWLPKLAPHLPLAVPVPPAEGRPGEGYPFEWSVYSWLEGENATFGRIGDQIRLAKDLAELLTALQRIDPSGGPPPGLHNFGRGAPLAERDSAARESIDALRGEIDVDQVTNAWEEALNAPAHRGLPVWIHGDLDSRNLLVQDGRLLGVIDWGGLGVGDPACDVMVAWKVFTTEARETFRAALAIDDATWARSKGWALSQAVNALSYYTLETNAVLVEESRRWLADVLADAA
jgi:aminoglycoside phosphotransferase (APT) family kinase protein